MNGFNGERLALARRRRGLTKVELGNRVNLTARRIASFENQGDVPPAATRAALAATLDFPEGFFFRPAPPGPTIDGISFRSLARLGAGRRDAAIAASSIAIELAHYFDARYRLPDVAIPDLRELDPRTAALAVRAQWALGDKPLPNAIHLLEAHGARVYSLVDECRDLDAFSFWYEGAPFAFLTSHKSPERSRWDVVHELAHLVLHQGEQPQGRETEHEADEFAAEFLMPADGVVATVPAFVTMREVRTEKVRWRVSALAYIRQLHRLGRLTVRQYKSLVIEASQAGYRRAEGDIDREISRTMPKLLGLLAEDGVSLAQIANDLGVKVGELRGLMFSSMRVVGGPSVADG